MEVQATRVSDPHSFDPDPDPAFRLETNPDPDPIPVQGFNDQKLKKKKQLKKILNLFLINLQFTYPKASIKYVQVTEEAFSSQKRPSNTSKHELLQKIFFFCGSFLPSWIRIRIPNSDLDPLVRLNPDPIRIRIQSGSDTLQATGEAFSPQNRTVST